MVIDNCTYYLENSKVPVKIGGYNIWGSPCTNVFMEWAFQHKQGEEIQKIWDMIPTETDILMTHSPPKDYGDGESFKSVRDGGCENLRDTVQTRVKPLAHVFGHIHEAYGVYSDGTTTFINAAGCTEDRNIANKAIVFDLPIKNNA